MKIYIATRLENHKQHNALRDLLVAAGHTLTYDWTKHGAVWRSGKDRIREVALSERAGVERADVVVVLLPGGRGTHVELGMALAGNKPVIIWSPRPEVFGAHPDTCAFYHDSGVRPVTGPLAHIVGILEYRDSRELKAARFLFTLIRQNNPNAREPNWRTWARTFDLLFRVDKREPAEVAKLIRWCQQDDFWHRNILSPDKFRKQYDRLKLASQSTKGGRREVRSARLQED